MNDTSIILFLGFAGSLIAIITPIIKLNTSITKLNVTMDNMNKVVSKLDRKVDDFEIRLIKLEENMKSSQK